MVISETFVVNSEWERGQEMGLADEFGTGCLFGLIKGDTGLDMECFCKLFRLQQDEMRSRVKKWRTRDLCK